MKYHAMMLCMTGTWSLLSPLHWVDDWHVVRWCAFDNKLEALEYIADIPLSWITENPYDKNLPEWIRNYISKNNLHVIY